MITLGIIEDHKDITQLLGDFFEEDAQISVVSTATHVDAFIHKSKGLEVDIILLDLSLPFRNGMDCIDELKTAFPNCSIIAVPKKSKQRASAICSVAGRNYQ